MSSRKRSRENIDTERQEVLAYIERGYAFAFQIASDEVQGDFEVALAAVKKNGCCLGFASDELQNNHEVVLAAVRQNGLALSEASPELRGYHDIVLAAVRQDGDALKYASSELRADRDVVSAAVHQNYRALEHASPELRADRDIVLAALRRTLQPWVFLYVCSTLRADKSFVLNFIREDGIFPPAVPGIFQHAGNNLRSDHDLVARVIAVSRSPSRVLPFVSDGIKGELLATARDYDTVGQAQAFLHDSRQSYAAIMEFLCCVTSRSAGMAKKPVTMLNLDTDTFQELHRHIAAYVYAGVSPGQGLSPVHLVKRVFPILEACFQGRDNDEQNLALLLEDCGYNLHESNSEDNDQETDDDNAFDEDSVVDSDASSNDD